MNKSVLDLVATATAKADAHLAGYVERTFLAQRVELQEEVDAEDDV